MLTLGADSLGVHGRSSSHHEDIALIGEVVFLLTWWIRGLSRASKEGPG